MNDETEQGWTADEAALPSHDRLLSIERQLALVDRILGLEARLSEAAATRSLTPPDQLTAEQQLIVLRASPAWRIGRTITSPVRMTRRIRGR